MLFFLSGEIQTGKTRWLDLLVSTLESKGVSVQGVLAPGVWRDHGLPIQGGEEAESRFVDANGFEKIGIDNLLLPDRKLVSFARREDLARSEGTYDERAQSASMDMHWHIADEAVREVNAHLAELPKETIGSVQAGTRPVLITQSNWMNDRAPMAPSTKWNFS